MLEENYFVKTRLVRIYPNAALRHFIIRNIKFRDEQWNTGLHLWNQMQANKLANVNAIEFNPNKKHPTYYYKKRVKSEAYQDKEKLTEKEEKELTRILDRKHTNLKNEYDSYEHPKKVTYTIDHKTKAITDPHNKNKILRYLITPNLISYVPSYMSVRDRLVQHNRFIFKYSKYPQYYPNSLTDAVAQDLAKSYKAFYDPEQPNAKRPKKKFFIDGNGTYTDTQANIKADGKIYPSLGKGDPKRKQLAQGIKAAEDISDLISDKRIRITFIHRNHKFYAAITDKQPLVPHMPTGQMDAVDVNVHHFDSALTAKPYCITPARLERYYQRIAHEHRQMAKKRSVVTNKFQKDRKHQIYQMKQAVRKGLKTKAELKHLRRELRKKRGELRQKWWKGKNYQRVDHKLRHDYRKATNIQHDLVQKFTTDLVKYRDEIYIEDLDVHAMSMGIASKGLHRALFGYFRQVLTYKCQEYGRKLIIVNRWFPSTQLCPYCGMAKSGKEKVTLQGNKLHHTAHNEFVCLNPNCPMCGVIQERDAKVPSCLVRYREDSMPEIIERQRYAAKHDLGMYRVF